MLQVVTLDCNTIRKVCVIICYFLYFVVVFSFKTKKHKLDFLLEHLKEGRSKLFFFTQTAFVKLKGAIYALLLVSIKIGFSN